MPLIFSLAAPGSPHSRGLIPTTLAYHLTIARLPSNTPSNTNPRCRLSVAAGGQLWPRLLSSFPSRPLKLPISRLAYIRHEQALFPPFRYYSSRKNSGEVPVVEELFSFLDDEEDIIERGSDNPLAESDGNQRESHLPYDGNNKVVQNGSKRLEHPLDNDQVPSRFTEDVARIMENISDLAYRVTQVTSQIGYADRLYNLSLSRQSKKKLRPSRPGTVLQALHPSVREHYAIDLPQKTDLSYTPRGHKDGKTIQPLKVKLERKPKEAVPEAISLYSILARYLQHNNGNVGNCADFQYTQLELDLLQSKRFTTASVATWASCLSEPRSKEAVKILLPGADQIPFFLILLILRRKHLRTSALGIVIRHVEYRLKSESINWGSLELLIIRLLRHAREVWPESLPWITNLFLNEATKLYDRQITSRADSLRDIATLTSFTNTLLMLLSLPTSQRPLLSASLQEKAQFQILQFMASCKPAIALNRSGFRSVARNQLAHSKTPREQEWAKLKGQSWPPWKESKTAMDEDRGQDFGVSRASQILQRMHDAGYGGRVWEELVEIYAGWDSDSSPTIQTRTSLPRLSSRYQDENLLRALAWAGRIRATRTRREAWACFLAFESTDERPHDEIYLAMFEKLHYQSIENPPTSDERFEIDKEFEHQEDGMLAGDMKEVLEDPKSPLSQVYLSEPVPTYEQLYERMLKTDVRASKRLRAFFLETCPHFDMSLGTAAESAQTTTDGIRSLIAGDHSSPAVCQAMPDYLFKAFIAFLCRFGTFSQNLSTHIALKSPKVHARNFPWNKQYLLEYACSLLLTYRPKYRPAWTTFLKKLVKDKDIPRTAKYTSYKITLQLIEAMEAIDLDIDDDIFHLVCTATLHALQSTARGHASPTISLDLYSTGSSRLRTLFHDLVGTNAGPELAESTDSDSRLLQTHVPDTSILHTFVRALGAFDDYEGLYSFSTWLVKNHGEVTARAASVRSGNKALFRTLVALRAGVQGDLGVGKQSLGGSQEIAQLVRTQIAGIEEWGGWPDQEYVDLYLRGKLKSAMPVRRK